MLDAIEHLRNYDDVIIYMPTWRDDNPDFISEAIPNFSLLNDVCKKNNALFVFKVHLNTVFKEDLNTYSNLLKLDSSLDMYPLLPFSTVLVTDYSSIFFDYAALKKKIIFYPFDLRAYKLKSRELYFNYEEITKGEIVSYSFNELLNIICDKNLQPGNHDSFSKFLYSGEFNYDEQINFIKRSVGIKVHE
jgi:CDP-glycerol glycerophosphotransferase (TagB/SpsB family)